MTDSTHTYDLVVGLGKSGQAMARFLKHLGAEVIATDLNRNLTDPAAALNRLGIGTRIGAHDPELFRHARTIYMSPGIPASIPPVRSAVRHGVPVTGELDLFAAHNTAPVVAVTGTNGKTTVTTLIGEMLKAAGKRVFVGGNIGTPMVESLMEGTSYDVIVIEVSSFQLDLARAFRPDIGVLLNITPDHMDRYPDFQAYTASKWSLFRNQTDRDMAVFNRHIDPPAPADFNLQAAQAVFPLPPNEIRDQIRALPPGAGIRSGKLFVRTAAGESVIRLDQYRLKGRHNLENLAAATLAAVSAGAGFPEIQAAVDRFEPIAHRMAYTATINRVPYYNDSKATNPDAVIRAIECFEKNIILIMGGREKDTDFAPILPAVARSVKTVIAIGETREKIGRIFGGTCPVFPETTMRSAVERACALARPGDTVLLAPACASFDMYGNYQERGNDFTSAVKDMAKRI